MKIIIQFMIGLFLSFNLSAQVVSFEVARQKAIDFFSINNELRNSLKSTSKVEVDSCTTFFVKSGLKKGGKSYNEPALYVINRIDKPGFIIFSADYRTKSILGYSLSGTFSVENTPPVLLEWLDNYILQIDYIKENSSEINNLENTEWLKSVNLKMESNSEKIVEPLLGDINFQQGETWNRFCPEISGSHTLVGCAAVAMAQVMKYWEWPIQGVGTNSYTWWNGIVPKNLSADFSSTTYYWNKMSSNIADEYNSTLLYQCGVSVDMDYALDASGIDNNNVVSSSLKEHFKYDNSVSLIWKYTVSDDDWILIIKNELVNKRPVIYGGGSTFGGNGKHVFVIDGINIENEVHINWGWGSNDNGDWWTFSDLTPKIYDFTSEQHAIIGINPSSTKYFKDLLVFNPKLSQENVVAGTSLTATCRENNIGNSTTEANSVTLWLSKNKILNESEDIKLGEIQFPTLGSNSYSNPLSVEILIPLNTSPDNYYLFFWADGNKEIAEHINNSYFEYNNFASVPLSITAPTTNPTIAISPSSLTFGDVTVNETSTKDFAISGSNLTGNVSVSVSGTGTGFAISKSQSSGFGTSSLSFSPSGGSVSGTVYVRFSPTSTGSKTGSISITSSGATSKTVSLSGSGVSAGSAPSNDNSSSPQSLAIKTSCSYESYTTINATPPVSDVPFYGSSTCTSLYKTTRYDDDVWFYIQPTGTSPVTITVNPTSNLSNFDIALGLYSSSLSQMTCGAKGDVGIPESITFTPQANTSYLIRVFSYGEGSSYSGDFDICVTSSSDDTDDDCNITILEAPSDGSIYSDNSTDDYIAIEGKPNCPLTVSKSCSWVTITSMNSKIQSNGQAFIDFYLDENISKEPRICTIIINGQSITIRQGERDFYIEHQKVEQNTVRAGDEIEVSCEQCYYGAGSNLKSYVGYYLSEDMYLDKNDILLETDYSTLDDDECSNEVAVLTIPGGTTPKTYYILFVADYDERFDETDEKNNVEYKQITVNSDCTQVPEYDMEFSLINSYSIGESIEPGSCKVYRFRATEGSLYNFKTGCAFFFTDTDFDTYLELYNSNGEKLKEDDNGCPPTLSIIDGWKCPSDGNYYIKVRGHSYSDYGKFLLICEKTDCKEIPEYDIEFSLTTKYSIGHFIEPGSCRVYRFWATEDGIYSFKTGCTDFAEADFDTYLELYSSNGEKLREDDNGCPPTLSTIDGWKCTSSGNYYIKVSGLSYSDFGEFTLMCEKATLPPPEVFVSTTLLDFGEIELRGTMPGGFESLMTKTSLAYSNVETASSSVKSFTVSGSNLTDDILISAPNGNEFTVSLDSSTGYDSFLDLRQSNGTISTTTIYVRFSPASISEKSGDISISSSGVTTQKIVVSGIGIEATPCNLSVSDTILTFNASPGNQTVMITSNSNWIINIYEDPVNIYPVSGGSGGVPITTNDGGPVDAPGIGQWITISSDSGSNNGTMMVTVPGNNGSARSGTITVSGCNTTKTIKIIQEGNVTQTFDNLLEKKMFKIYPNPTTGIIEIEGLPENQETRISVYTDDGKLILLKTVRANREKIDLSKQTSGTYLILVNDLSVKIVKN